MSDRLLDVLLGLTLGGYGTATTSYLLSLTSKRDFARIATNLAWMGLAAQGTGIIVRGIQIGRPPLANLFESLTFLSWALVAIYLLVERRQRSAALGWFVTLVAVIVTGWAATVPRDVTIHPALQSRWLTVHVISSLVGYAGFTLAFAATLGYLIQERLLKRKKINPMQQHLPSLEAVDHLAYKMVAVAFPMLTLGVVTGSLWAQTAGWSYWSWDPKEIWSLVTWLVYAAYFHVRVVRGWRGKWANRLLLIGFAAVLITFFGVNFLPEGLHKYSW